MQVVNLCIACTRYHRNVNPDGTGATCEAFPDQIPVPIFNGTFDHRQQFADEALLFDLIPGFDAAVEVFEARQVAGE